MSFFNYFKPVSTITADKAREMIKGKKPEEFCLLDVRQPEEYEQGHIPGAVLIPIDQLPERLGELDPGKPTIVYCAVGGRSRTGASILRNAGFSEPLNLKGGISAWNGLSTAGPPEAGMAYFAGVEEPGDILSLAWALGEGSRRFYEEMANIIEDPEGKKVFNTLTEIEKKHQKFVTDLYDEVTGNISDPAAPFYTKYLPENEMEQLMAGQTKLGQALAWARQHSLREVLEYSISLEAKLYDLYFRMKGKHTEPTVNKIYSTLAAEEKNHLDVFIDLLDHRG